MKSKRRYQFNCHPHDNPNALVADHKRWAKWKARKKMQRQSRKAHRE